MYGGNRRDPSPPTHFSVHAEFTISHPGSSDPRNQPRTSTEKDEATGGVRMTYTWQPEGWAESEIQSEEGPKAWPPSSSNSNRSLFSDTPSSATLTPTPANAPHPANIAPPSAVFGTPYTRGVQQGNMFFTSTPPSKGAELDTEKNSSEFPKDIRLNSLQEGGRGGLKHDSSGYGSDLLSPNSLGGSLPRRVAQPYNRKCKSTCNITLSTNLTGPPDPLLHSQCGRTQSLRCQTPSSSVPNTTPIRYYGCGDPWCHHLRPNDALSSCGRMYPVPEMREESTPSSKLPSRASTFTMHDHMTNKKDASVQTFEMVDKCTSPFLRMNSTDSVAESSSRRKYQRRGLTEPIGRKNYSPSSCFTPDSLDSVKPARRLTRSPKLGRLPAFDHSDKSTKELSPVESKASDSLKKPRTVHIDVYCTGTELESDGSNSSEQESESKSASTPQTVFENEKMRVTHRKADERDLPFYLRNRTNSEESTQVKSRSFEQNTSLEREDSDEDNASTAYPSKMSSYSNIGDYSASISSVPRSWTTYSMSSCAIPEDYDSIANTSWKDTFSDIESLLHSRSSIAPTESLDFMPKKLYQKEHSIDETPEYNRKDLLDTPSVASIQPSDSFEYANSEDKFRIRKMEEMWKSEGKGKSYKSPMSEKTLHIQQKKMQEYMERKIKGRSKWGSKDSDSNDSDDSGKGWTFVKGPRRDTVVRRLSKGSEKVSLKAGGNKDLVRVNKVENDKATVQDSLNLLPNTVRDGLVRSTSPQKISLPTGNAFFREASQEPPSSTVKDSPTPSNKLSAPSGATNSAPTTDTLKTRPPPLSKLSKPPPKEDQGSLSDSSPTSRSPNYRTVKQRLSLDPNLRSPFMLVPGIYTEPRSIARKFGTVVSVMKKPGHHIGPAKNPDCLCEHCQSYWESVGYRGRTRSMGDPPSGGYVRNWKDFLGEEKGKDGGKVVYTDY